MKTSKVVLGAVAGLAVGGILGILFAPNKGSVTRQQIRDKGNDYAGELKSKYDELADSIAKKLQSAKGFTKGLAENGSTKFEDDKNDVYNTASNQNY